MICFYLQDLNFMFLYFSLRNIWFWKDDHRHFLWKKINWQGRIVTKARTVVESLLQLLVQLKNFELIICRSSSWFMFVIFNQKERIMNGVIYILFDIFIQLFCYRERWTVKTTINRVEVRSDQPSKAAKILSRHSWLGDRKCFLLRGKLWVRQTFLRKK